LVADAFRCEALCLEYLQRECGIDRTGAAARIGNLKTATHFWGAATRGGRQDYVLKCFGRLRVDVEFLALRGRRPVGRLIAD
jgi:hypothetical protein